MSSHVVRSEGAAECVVLSRLLGGDSRGGRRLDRVGVDGGVLLGGGVGGGGLLVLLHLIVVLEVTIILLIILVLSSRVLLGSLGEVDDLATGTVGDDVVQVEGALGLSLGLILLLGYTAVWLETWKRRVEIVFSRVEWQ